MQFFHRARRLALCVALLAGPASTRLMAGAQASPAPAQSGCGAAKSMQVPHGQSLALDAAAHVLIVATSTGLVLLDSCTGRRLGQPIDANGNPSQVAVDSSAGIAVVVVSLQVVRRFDIHRRLWLANVTPLPSSVYPVQVAVVSRTHQVLILDQTSSTLWVADIRTGQVHHAVKKLPGLPTAVGVDASRHRAFVASEGSGAANTVSVIDTTTWLVVQRTPVGRTPLAVAVSSRMGLVFVANRDSKSLSVLSAASGKLLNTIQLTLTPQSLAINDQLGRVYVATKNSKGGQGPLLVLNIIKGPVRKSITLPGAILAVDPQTGDVFYLDPSTGKIRRVPASGGGPPTPTPKAATPTPISTATPPPSSTATPTNTGFNPSKYQILFNTDFLKGWDQNWLTTVSQADSSCIKASNADNRYAISIVYSGHCAKNQALIERWHPSLFANGAVNITFTATGRAVAGMAARTTNDSSYVLYDVVVGSKGDYICLTKWVSGKQAQCLRDAVPAPVAPSVPRTLALMAQGNVLTVFYNNAILFSYSDATPLLARGQWAFFAQGAGPYAVPGQQGRLVFTHLTLYQQ